MHEIWKEIDGFKSIYEVSNLGRVRSLDRMVISGWGTPRFRQGGIRKSRIGETGYHYLILCKEGSKHTRKIHRLVAAAFCPRPVNHNHVNHMDGDRLNNRSDNLEWVTPSKNTRHAYTTGLQTPKRGDESSSATIGNSDVDEIRAMILEGRPITEVADAFSTTKSVILSIKTGRRWCGIGCPDLAKRCKESSFRGRNHAKRKLSDAQVMEIIQLLSQGLTSREIGATYGVHHMTISAINRGKSHSHICPRDGRQPPYNPRRKNQKTSP